MPIMNYIKNRRELDNFFTEEYYNSINYSDYTLRKQKYKSTAEDIVKYFFNKSVKDGHKEEYSILDYGCAIGMLLDGIRDKIPHASLAGYDISQWAIDNPVSDGLSLTNDPSILLKSHNLTIALDVFEHMFDVDLVGLLDQLNTHKLLVRIPVKCNSDQTNDFHLEVSRRDRSHVNCKTKGEWIDFIEDQGYQYISSLNLPTIYDAKGCFCGYFYKIKH